MPRSAAELAGLPRMQVLTCKDLADWTGASVETIRRRCREWSDNPRALRGIPFLKKLGRPYRIRLEVALQLADVPPEERP